MEDNKPNIFEQASRIGLLFSTTNGVINVTDMWKLSLERLQTYGTLLENDLSDITVASTTSKFASTTAKPNKEREELQLKVDIVAHIYQTKSAEKEAAESAKANKEFNHNIDLLIAEQEQGQLKSLTVDELKKLKK